MEREEKLMQSNKWKFLLTGAVTLTLLTVNLYVINNQLQKAILHKQLSYLLQK